MDKKQPIRVPTKKMIEALRKGKMRWKDLAKLETGVEGSMRQIPESTLNRVLSDLKYWELASEQQGYWVWFEHSRTFNSKHEVDLFIEHSRGFLPSLHKMLNAPTDDAFINLDRPWPSYTPVDVSNVKIQDLKDAKNIEYVEQHLKSGYPDVFARLQKSRELKTEIKENLKNIACTREFLNSLQELPKTINQSIVIDWKSSCIRVMCGPLATFEVNMLAMGAGYGKAEMIRRATDGRWYIIGPAIKKDHEMNMFSEKIDQLVLSYKSFTEEILRLIMKVESENPLEGACEACPKARIINTTHADAENQRNKHVNKSC